MDLKNSTDYFVIIDENGSDDLESKLVVNKYRRSESVSASVSVAESFLPQAPAAVSTTKQAGDTEQRNNPVDCVEPDFNHEHDYHYHRLPLFTITISLILIISFVLASSQNHNHNQQNIIAKLDDLSLIYCPVKKHELWRLVTYMLVHSSWTHLILNLFVQILISVPLELMYGSGRIGSIYILGILAGSLSVSVFSPNICLVGASSGIYALLASHLSHVILNYAHLEFVPLRVLGVLLIAIVGHSSVSWSDLSPSVSWFASTTAATAYSDVVTDKLPVSDLAHFAGAFTGFMAGLVLLKCYSTCPPVWIQFVRWFAFGVTGGFLGTLILITCQ